MIAKRPERRLYAFAPPHQQRAARDQAGRKQHAHDRHERHQTRNERKTEHAFVVAAPAPQPRPLRAQRVAASQIGRGRIIEQADEGGGSHARHRPKHAAQRKRENAQCAGKRESSQRIFCLRAAAQPSGGRHNGCVARRFQLFDGKAEPVPNQAGKHTRKQHEREVKQKNPYKDESEAAQNPGQPRARPRAAGLSEPAGQTRHNQPAAQRAQRDVQSERPHERPQTQRPQTRRASNENDSTKRVHAVVSVRRGAGRNLRARSASKRMGARSGMPNPASGYKKPPMTIPVSPASPTTNSTSPPRPRVALIGCGRVGDVHRERLAGEPANIVAVCDPDADALARMANRLPRRPRLFRTEQDLLAANLANAVILCTPHARHAAQVRAALDANVHVLCEKPFVMQTSEARELIALARKKERALFVSLARRGRGHTRFLLAAAGRIGPLTRVVMSRAQPWLGRHGRTWRVRSGEGGGFTLDAGASLLDLLLRLAQGEGTATLTRLDAELAGTPGVDVDVRASLRLAFASSSAAAAAAAAPRTLHADVSLVGDATESVEVIQLFGERGTAGWLLREDAAPLLYLRPAGGPTEEADSARFRGPLPDAAFVAALSTPGRDFGPDAAPDLFDAASVVPLVALLERIYAQAVWR